MLQLEIVSQSRHTEGYFILGKLLIPIILKACKYVKGPESHMITGSRPSSRMYASCHKASPFPYGFPL